MKTTYIERRSSMKKKGTLEIFLAITALLAACGISLAISEAKAVCTIAVSLATVFLLAMCLVTVRYTASTFEYELNEDALVVRRIGKRDTEIYRVGYDRIAAFFPMNDAAAKRYPSARTVDACATLYARLGRGIAVYSRGEDGKLTRLLFEPTASFCETLSENLRG